MLNLPTLLKTAALTGPPSPCQQLILEPAKGFWETWIPVALSLVQFFALAWLTWYVFIRGAKQRTAERQANWYHKIVVDHSIVVLADFFATANGILCGCTERLPGLTGVATEKEYDIEVRQTIADFAEKLRLMRDALSGRLAFFDGNMTESFLERADRFEDAVTIWFDAYKRAKPFDQRDSLPKLLIDCQNELLGIIKGYEFSTWK